MSEYQPNDYASFLYAMAVGCLDKEDYIQLIEYLENGGDFPFQELGEYQNLAALLPSFLNIESPPPELKDKVARRLYRLRDEKKPVAPKAPAIKQSQKRKTALTEKMIVPPPVPEFPQMDDSVTPAAEDEFKPVTPASRRASETARPAQDTQVRRRMQQTVPNREKYAGGQDEQDSPRIAENDQSPDMPSLRDSFVYNDEAYNKPPQAVEQPAEDNFTINLDMPESQSVSPTPEIISAPEISASTGESSDLEAIRRKVVEKVEKENEELKGRLDEMTQQHAGVGKGLFFFVVTLLIAIIGGIYYLLTAQIEETKKTVNDTVTTQLQQFGSENQQNQKILQLLSERNTLISALKGTSIAPNAFGKLMYSLDRQQGYIQLGNLPQPNGANGYQLWVNIDKSFYAVGGVLESTLNVEYHPLTGMPELPKNKPVRFIVTQEAIGTVPASPGSAIFLEGILQ